MERFGPFELLRALGRGGMAETFLARRRGDDGFEQIVCLKRILPSLGRDAGFVRAFQNEARLAARLRHPHIAQVHVSGCHHGTHWMTMEYVEGGDLRALRQALARRGEPLPIEAAWLLLLDLASALAFAHDLALDGVPARLVHRDVSPSNVLVDRHGHFKLADFGIAKALAWEHEAHTRTGEVKGKAAYMSPEQVLGQPLDASTDLWAMGVVLYEVLAGERPFRGATEIATLLQVAEGTHRPLREAAPHAPTVLVETVERLLARDPGARFRHASEVLDALADVPPPSTNARRTLAAITPDDLDAALKTLLPWDMTRRLDAEAPTHFEAPTGSRVAVDYEADGAPVLAIRVQELFGLSVHPALAGGRVPLTLHLLSPAHRPIQITRDLPGFWSGSWAAVKADMKGRYPRHPWPDNPAQAAPTTRAKPRGT